MKTTGKGRTRHRPALVRYRCPRKAGERHAHSGADGGSQCRLRLRGGARTRRKTGGAVREKGPDNERPALSFGFCPFRIRFASGARLPQGRHLSRAMRMTSTASATTMNTQVMENPPRHSLATCLYRTVLHVTTGKPYL